MTNNNKLKKLSYLLSFVFVYYTSSFSAFAQYPQTPQLQQDEPQKPTIIPKEEKTGPINNRKNGIKRIPSKTGMDGTGTRQANTTELDETAIAGEESRRLEREAELGENPESMRIIKRTFGSSIFSNNKIDIGSQSNIATPSNYVLGSGDKLNVDIFGYSQYKQSATINSDGNLVLDKAGVIGVSGLNIEEAENKIKNAYSKIFLGLNGGSGYPSNTFLKLSLTGYRTIKVKITGEVVAPGTYTLTSFTSLLNSLYACGGPNEIGTYRNIKLIRGNKVVSVMDLYEILNRGFSKADMLLKDQDIVHVGPYISRVTIDGNTKRKGYFELNPTEKLVDLISYAGGFDQNAYTDVLKIYRNTSKDKKILDIKSDRLSYTTIQTGDSVYVEKVLDRYENLVTIEGAVFRPGNFSLDQNQNLSSIIKSADGLKEEALQGRVTIIRTNDDLSVSNFSVNLDDIKQGRVSDLALKRQDRVIIPSLFDLTEVSYVKIQGAINNPQATEGVEIPFIRNMTVKDLIITVGGLTEAASYSKVEIVRRKRNVDPKQIDAQISEIIEFEISSDLGISNEAEKQFLLPFDEVFIRTSPNYEKQNFVTVKGEVIYPGKYGIKFKDEKISDLIGRSGGISPLAYLKGATLVRRTLLSDFQKNQREEALSSVVGITKIKKATKKETFEDEVDAVEELEGQKELTNEIVESVGIDLDKILKNPGSSEDILLNDGDEIFIPKKLQTVRIEGEVLYPTTVKFTDEMKFIDYISRSGGFTKKSSQKRAFIIYPNGSVDRTRKFLFVKIYPKVEPGSEIIVPSKTEAPAAQFTQIGNIIATLASTVTTFFTVYNLVKLNAK